MSKTIYFRRSVAVLASAGATAALTLLPATGAHAAVAGLYAAAAESGADFVGSGGGTCDLSSGTADVMSGIRHFSHGTKKASASGKATFTNSLDPSDKVTVKTSVDSTMTLKKKHNDLSVFDMTVGGSVVVNHTITGSQCKGSGEAIAETQVQFTEHKKGWFTLTRDTKKPNSFVEFVVINVKTGQEVTLDVFQGTNSHSTGRAKLKPGTYAIEEGVAGITSGGVGPFAKAQPRSTKVAQTIHIHADFTPLKH